MGTEWDRDMQVTTRGRAVTAEEWHAWRARGMSADEIAAVLGISPSMARLIGRRFRSAGVPDPQYWKRPRACGELDASTDAGAYILGILWGTTAVSGGSFLVRHRDRFYPAIVKERLGIAADIHEVDSLNGRQHRLKIIRSADVAALERVFARHGWSPRNASRRPYPAGDVDDRGFVRAWVELHNSYDVIISRSKVERPRLRVYGNYELMGEINRVLAAACGVSLRKLQKTPNTITKGIYYVGESCQAVLAWLYHDAELFNPQSRLVAVPPDGRGGGAGTGP